MKIFYYHKLYKSMEIVIIFLILLNFCSGDTSYFFDDSGRTNICYNPSPCKFKKRNFQFPQKFQVNIFIMNIMNHPIIFMDIISTLIILKINIK